MNNFSPKNNGTEFSSAAAAMRHMNRTGNIPYAYIKEKGLECILDLAEAQGMDVKPVGKELQILNPRRNDTEFGSYSINTDTGMFADFAVDDCKGGDVIAWVAYNRDCKQSEAAKWILAQLTNWEQPPSAVVPAPGRAQTTVITSTPQQLGQPQADDLAQIKIPDDFFQVQMRKQGMSLEASYEYRHASGVLAFVVLRLRDSRSGKKSFRPVHPAIKEAGGVDWVFKMPEGPRPLYNLARLVALPDAWVFVVEGEKAAEAAQRMFPQAVVVTTAGGAQSPEKTDLCPLVGRQVLIWPDHDQAGDAYAKKVVQKLRDLSPDTPLAVVDPGRLYDQLRKHEPKIPQLPDLSGWDAADLEHIGMDANTVQEVIVSTTSAVPEADVSNKQAATKQQEQPESITNVTWPRGYRYALSSSDVHKWDQTMKGWRPICSRIEIQRQLRDGKGQGWSLDLQIQTGDGCTQTFIMSRGDLADSNKTKAALMNRGVTIYDMPSVMAYLGMAQHDTTHDLTHQVGWANTRYVLANHIYGLGADRVALHPDAPTFRDHGVSGNLTEWNANIGRLAIGNSRLMAAILTALAGPLVKLVGMDNGGFHFYGASSSGKTTLLRAGASVLGRQQSVLRTWRSTANALELVAAGLNDSTLFLDEMGQVKADEAGEIVYMLANGQGKSRMTRTAQQGRLLEWTLLFLSTGEISLQQAIESGNGKIRAGMEIRLVNLPADAGVRMGVFENLHEFPNGKALADHLSKAASDKYGAANDAWLEFLTSQMHRLGESGFCQMCRTRLDAHEAELLPTGADGQVGRVARRLALLILAGELAAEAGIGRWSVEDVKTAMQRCLADWIRYRGGTGPSEETQALYQAQAFFEEHGASAFQRLGIDGLGSSAAGPEARPVVHRAGFFDPAGDDGHGVFYVFPTAFKDRVCSGLNRKLVKEVLRQKGLLLQDSTNTLRLSGVSDSARYYQISGRIVGFSNNE